MCTPQRVNIRKTTFSMFHLRNRNPQTGLWLVYCVNVNEKIVVMTSEVKEDPAKNIEYILFEG